jgi:hypothetical protein
MDIDWHELNEISVRMIFHVSIMKVLLHGRSKNTVLAFIIHGEWHAYSKVYSTKELLDEFDYFAIINEPR